MLERIQILIDTETRQLIEQKARLEGKSVSKTIRESLRKEVSRAKGKGRTEALKRFADKTYKGKGGNEYDKYAYNL